MASLSKSKRNLAPPRPGRGHDDFLEPLRFDPEDNGLSIENPQIKWLMNSDYSKIDLGGLLLDESMIGFSLDQIPRNQATARFDDPNGPHKNERYLISFSLRWPEVLARTGTVIIEDLNERIVWSSKVEEVDRGKWSEALSFATDVMKANHSKNNWGTFDVLREKFAFIFSGKPFRMCFTKEVSEIEKMKSCSSPYFAQTKGELFRLQSAKQVSTAPLLEPGYYFGGKKLNNTGLLNFAFTQPSAQSMALKIIFRNGSYLSLSSQPGDPKLLDAVQSPDGAEVILTGIGTKPLGNRVRVIKKPITHFWAPTGIDQEQIWQVGIPNESPTVRILGAFNIPFTLLFNYDRLPKEADRVYVQETRSSGTYSSNPTIYGYVPSAGELSSQEESITKLDQYHFAWRFAAPYPDFANRSKITIQSANNPKPWVAHHRMYRTYPNEVSIRLTGILEQDFTFFLMGELSAAAWFETIGSWQNRTFSKQRWGMAARYFKSLSPIQTSGSVPASEFSVLNADLKYNFLPGIWHRDELVGLNLSLQQVAIAGTTVNLAGLGTYWARTMPKIFDQIFNIIPVFDFPKYVDMEFIYYPISLTSSATAGSTYCLNFHGRVFWTRRIYGEAGFGFRHYQFSVPRPADPSKNSTLDLSTSYGTFGLGVVF